MLRPRIIPVNKNQNQTGIFFFNISDSNVYKQHKQKIIGAEFSLFIPKIMPAKMAREQVKKLEGIRLGSCQVLRIKAQNIINITPKNR